jgi:hypothetical protein
MRFKLYTTVDITETNAKRQEDRKLYSQQTNYNTVLQTIGLRVNLVPVYVKDFVDDISKIGFGNTIKGKQRYWEFCFEVEYEGALTLDMLNNDFDLIPVIAELDETVHNHNKIFRTKCPNECNVVFKIE